MIHSLFITRSLSKIALHVQSLHNSHLKRTFLESFANDPVKLIHTWLESQSRDLESILGSGPSEGATIRTEELKRTEFFRLPWVEEGNCSYDLVAVVELTTCCFLLSCCSTRRYAPGCERNAIGTLYRFVSVALPFFVAIQPNSRVLRSFP